MNSASLIRSFDPANLPPAYYLDPYPYLHALREHAPVYRCPDGSFFLTRHADMYSVYRNPKLFSSAKTAVFRPLFGDSLLYQHHTTSLVFNDPPLHTQVRKAFGNALAPRTVTAMQASVEALVDELLDRIEAKHSFDLVTDFAAAIPIEVIGNLLRIPHEERSPLRRWSLAILGALEFRMTPQRFAEGNQAVAEFLDYLRDFVPRRRKILSDAEDDLLARLLRWESDGFRLSAEALYHQLIFLLNAGHETTTNLISNGILALLERPDQLQLLTSSPELIDPAIEELLRFEAPIQLNNRITTEATEIAGVSIPAGCNLTLCIAAANRDPAVFEQPDRLDITRHPNEHFAFGSGIHTCAGLHVARLEGRVAIARMLDRFPQLRLSGEIERAQRARLRVILSAPMSLA
jgi:cytochrome P450